MYRHAKLVLASTAVGVLLLSGCRAADPASVGDSTRVPTPVVQPTMQDEARDAAAVGAPVGATVASGPTGAGSVQWQACPGGDLDASPQFSTWDFAISDIAAASTPSSGRQVIVAQLTAPAGALHETWAPQLGDGPYAQQGGPSYDGGDPSQAWDVIFPALGVTPPPATEQPSTWVYFDHYAEGYNLQLDMENELPEPATCRIARVSVPVQAVLDFDLFGARPGGFGPIRVGSSGADLLAMGVVAAQGSGWVSKDSLTAEGVVFTSEDGDTLDQITIDVSGRWGIDGVALPFDESTIPAGYRAVGLDVGADEVDAGAASKWVLFSDEGALTLWLDEDGMPFKAFATAGTDLGSYDPPVIQ